MGRVGLRAPPRDYINGCRQLLRRLGLHVAKKCGWVVDVGYTNQMK